MKKIVVASNAFKGSLSSLEVAVSVEKGIHTVYPDCIVTKVGVADGGSGTVEAMVEALQGEKIYTTVHDPLMHPIEACYGVVNNGTTAVIEMAAASGLTLVPENKRNPMKTTSYGTGELIADALCRGYRKFIIGLGDSATNDAGMGMLQALGVRFLDASNNELGYGGEMLHKVCSIDISCINRFIYDSYFHIASDVDAPLYGESGAAYVFAPQKGATFEMVQKLDTGLYSLAKVVGNHTGVDMSCFPGVGAAGGLGFAFRSFMSAEIVSGISLVLDTVGFDTLIDGADLIITGEGRLDNQTIKGKTPSVILNAAKRFNIPVVAICGSFENSYILNNHGFTAVFSILSSSVSLEKSMEKSYAMNNISETVTQIMRVTAIN